MPSSKKTAEYKTLVGNPGRRKIDPSEFNKSDIAQKPLGAAPKTLEAPSARARWAKIRKDAPWLRQADSTAVELLCRTWGRLDEAESPSVINSLTKQINELLWNLGCSGYSSRKNLDPAPPDEKNKHPAKAFE